jgi:photosystem II stability/assembly factor-like uncharacterized protein
MPPGRKRSRSLAVVAVAVVLVLVAVAGVGTWATLRSGPAAPPTLATAASGTASLAQATPSPEPQAQGLGGGPALATDEQILDMGGTAAGGWILTGKRLLTTAGPSWGDCWRLGSGNGWGMIGQAVFVDGVVHVRLSTTLRTSTDGCASWSESSLPVDPVALAFPTAKVGYIIGGDKPLLQNPNATVFKTEDGGQHWTARATVVLPDLGVFPMMSFADALHGWITDGATVWTTADGGVAWSGTALPKPGSVSGQLSILTKSGTGADGSAVIAENFDVMYGMGGVPTHEVFYRTVDFGAHWTVASVIEDPVGPRLSLVDSKTWVVLDPSEPATVRTTTDAGSTWQTIAVRQRWPFDAGEMDFADALHGWLVVSEPYPSSPQPSGTAQLPSWGGGQRRPQPQHLVATDDGGATWHELTP